MLTQRSSHTLVLLGKILIQAQHKIHTLRSVRIVSLTVIAAVVTKSQLLIPPVSSQNHRSSDTIEKLDYRFMAELVESLLIFFKSHRGEH